MRRVQVWVWVLAAVVTALVVAGAVTVIVTRHGTGPAPSVAARTTTIGAGHGVRLAAEVVTPRGSGPFPLVVMPAPWVAHATVYDLLAKRLAVAGYAVVAYGQRGSADSGGKVDMMGPKTQADVSTVITWALAHLPADRHRIGAMGISYGAGASLLAAERDPRIRAVVAMSTWTDAAWSFDPGNTLASGALSVLLRSAQRTGHLDAQLTRLAVDVRSNPAAARRTVTAMARTRSPMTRVGALNRHGTAVMIANAWEDSIFSPDQLIPFFRALRTPKRLELAAGDHGGPERAALYGEPDDTADDAIAWLDHYLDGTREPITAQAPIQLRDVTDGTWHGYHHWPTARTRVRLGRPGAAGDVGGGAAPTWQASIATGTDSGAESGPALFQPSSSYQPPTVPATSISAAHAFVWNGGATATATRVSGTPRLRVRVASSAPQASVFLYLYDVDPTGVGRLMTATPYTVTGLRAGRVRSVDIALRPICWTVSAGHHLSLVVDTVDARYTAAEPPGSTVTVSSTTSDPAAVSVPVTR